MAKLNWNVTIYERVTLRDKAMLARQLATMLSAGVPLDQSFKILLAGTKNAILKKAYQEIIQGLEQGHSLSELMGRARAIFDPVFIAVVRSGEGSGQLDKVLTQLADRMEITQDFNTKVRSALTYPIFVIFTMIVIMVLMMVYVVPNLKTVFAQSEVELPAVTKGIIAVSNFTINYWWALIAFAGVLLIALFFFIRPTEGGSAWDRFKIRIPGMKEIYTEMYMARFCRTMAMLVQAGVPIIETLTVAANVIQNSIYTKSVKTIIAQVERGIPISVPMSQDKNFPLLVSQMVSVGEQTGRLEKVLTKTADFYEKESDALVKSVAGLIEPAIIIIIGIGVGVLVYGMIYPIYNVANVGF